MRTKLLSLFVALALTLSLFGVALPVAAQEGQMRSEPLDRTTSRIPQSPVERHMLDVGRATISIDGSSTDWSGISPIVSDPHGDQLSIYVDDDIWDVYMTDDGSNLYLRVDLASVGITWLYLDIDADQNINTGYNTNTDIAGLYLSGHDTGIDYTIEVDTDYATADLYAVDENFYVTYIGTLPVACADVVEVALPLSAIGQSLPYNLDFQTYYDGPQDEAPNTGNVTVTYGVAPPITIYVPGDYSTIQAAIDAATAGDTVQVAAGTYIENITLKDGVQVLGAGADVTTINGDRSGIVVTVHYLGSATKLDGFTITNGKTDYDGGGFSVWSSTLTISNNIITGNSATRNGGGIYASDSTLTINNNIVSGNTAGNGGMFSGGGIYFVSNTSGAITNNIITGNSATSLGGGICLDNSSPTIANNSVTGNSANNAGGIACLGASPRISNNNIVSNSCYGYGGGIFLTGSQSS